MNTLKNCNISDVEDLDFLDFLKNSEISFEEDIFGKKKWYWKFYDCWYWGAGGWKLDVLDV